MNLLMPPSWEAPSPEEANEAVVQEELDDFAGVMEMG